MDLPSVSFLWAGASKVWYVVPPAYLPDLKAKLESLLPREELDCQTGAWLRHKRLFPSPHLLQQLGIPFSQAVHLPGTIPAPIVL